MFLIDVKCPCCQAQHILGELAVGDIEATIKAGNWIVCGSCAEILYVESIDPYLFLKKVPTLVLFVMGQKQSDFVTKVFAVRDQILERLVKERVDGTGPRPSEN